MGLQDSKLSIHQVRMDWISIDEGIATIKVKNYEENISDKQFNQSNIFLYSLIRYLK